MAESEDSPKLFNLNLILNMAAHKLGCDVEAMKWYSWPEYDHDSFGGHVTPESQPQKKRQVFAFTHPEGGEAIKYCLGEWAPWDRVITSPR
jgi:hypothetical protein